MNLLSKFIIFAALFNPLIVPEFSLAQTKGHTELAHQVVRATAIRERLPQLIATIKGMERQRLEALEANQEHINEVLTLINEFFTYDFDIEGLEKAMATAYVEAFTEDELQEILNYLQSHAIQKYMNTQGDRILRIQKYMLSEMEKSPLFENFFPKKGSKENDSEQPTAHPESGSEDN